MTIIFLTTLAAVVVEVVMVVDVVVAMVVVAKDAVLQRYQRSELESTCQTIPILARIQES